MSLGIPSLEPFGKYKGVSQIIRYNWSLYVLTSFAATSCIAVAGLLVAGIWSRLLFTIGVFVICWMTTSLLVSHYVYDRSGLYDFRWMLERIPSQPRTWLNIHCGLDQTSSLLLSVFPGSKGQILDIFDPVEMTEPSIVRARGGSTALSDTPTANFRSLPVPSSTCDAVFLIFAAHEIRNGSSRREFFGEVARILSANGSVVMIEHLRDLPNFVGFGPGFLHFQSRREWLCVASSANLVAAREFALTPFVRVFLLVHKHRD
jgi:SAM-dependent methyltransferase